MGIYFEVLILYILLFSPGLAAFFSGMTTTAELYLPAELAKIFLFYMPSIALIWYLLFKVHKTEIHAIKPGKKDLISGLITLPFLLITGYAIMLISLYGGRTAAQITPHYYSPSTVQGWIVLCLSCIFLAYLEESYFRYYLLSIRKELNLNTASALALSVGLFSICHIYAGPWSILNAAISGTFLGLIFLRYNSLHGITIAHALYNISAFAMNAIFNK